MTEGVNYWSPCPGVMETIDTEALHYNRKSSNVRGPRGSREVSICHPDLRLRKTWNLEESIIRTEGTANFSVDAGASELATGCHDLESQ